MPVNQKGTIFLVGVTDGGKRSLSEEACAIVASSDLLVGGKRHLAFFPEVSHEKKRVIDKNLNALLDELDDSPARNIVVLASGDPFFYGIGKSLCERITKKRLVSRPAPGSLPLAFARAGIPWKNAALVSLHALPVEELIPALYDKETIGILTDDKNTPPEICRFIRTNFGEGFVVTVCENLDGDDEKITTGALSVIEKKSFSPLNVVIVQRKAKGRTSPLLRGPIIGIPDDEFHQRKPLDGLITKGEVRAVTLAKLELHPHSVVWDVGAGSGAVGIEAASFARKGWVYSIEKSEKDIGIIEKNKEKFMAANLTVVSGSAPEVFSSIPKKPDALFVGGSGGKMVDIIRAGYKALNEGGRIVVNVVALENLHLAMQAFRELKVPLQVVSLNIARSKPILDMLRFEPLTPVYILSAKKEKPPVKKGS